MMIFESRLNSEEQWENSKSIISIWLLQVTVYGFYSLVSNGNILLKLMVAYVTNNGNILKIEKRIEVLLLSFFLKIVDEE